MPIVNIPSNETDLNRVVFMVQELARGRNNAVGTFTLTTSATTTAVTSINCGAGSTVLIQPTTANAAAALTTTFIGTVANGSFTVTHANNAQTDRTYRYAISG